MLNNVVLFPHCPCMTYFLYAILLSMTTCSFPLSAALDLSFRAFISPITYRMYSVDSSSTSLRARSSCVKSSPPTRVVLFKENTSFERLNRVRGDSSESKRYTIHWIQKYTHLNRNAPFWISFFVQTLFVTTMNFQLKKRLQKMPFATIVFQRLWGSRSNPPNLHGLQRTPG